MDAKPKPLPDASMGEVLGLLDVLAFKGGKAELRPLARELLLEDAKLLAVLEAAETLGFAESAGAEARLRDEGKALLPLRISEKKRAAGASMLRVPLIAAFVRFLNGLGGRAKKRASLAEISRLLPEEDAEAQSRILTSWGRYGGVLAYRDDAEEYSIPKKEGP